MTLASPPTRRGAELGLVPIQYLPTGELTPSPENDELYRPVDTTDPEFLALVASVKEPEGIIEPIVATLDGFIVSGHRRHAAARVARLVTVPCRVLDFARSDDPDRFVKMLREFNRQRVKTFDERTREAVFDADPEESYQSLIEHRAAQGRPDMEGLAIEGSKTRAVISAAKVPFLSAVKRVLESLREYWPLSDRQIHYQLLNDPPLRHASKPGSVYGNTPESYKSLVDLVTRARVASLIPMHAIGDETRPVTVWQIHPEAGRFITSEIDGFLKGYWRDLMQSQPDHVEIVGEKNTVHEILKPVAAQYTIPLTIGRGFCSIPPRFAMAQRFKKSGKRNLVLLIVSDFDPDGQEIAHSFARSMRDDFGIGKVNAVKVALTPEQVERHKLPPGLQAKAGSTNFQKFTDKHGHDVFELEALPPAVLQQELRDAVDRVIDVAAFNHELDAEKKDAVRLEGVRRTVQRMLLDADLGAS